MTDTVCFCCSHGFTQADDSIFLVSVLLLGGALVACYVGRTLYRSEIPWGRES